MSSGDEFVPRGASLSLGLGCQGRPLVRALFFFLKAHICVYSFIVHMEPATGLSFVCSYVGSGGIMKSHILTGLGSLDVIKYKLANNPAEFATIESLLQYNHATFKKPLDSPLRDIWKLKYVINTHKGTSLSP